MKQKGKEWIDHNNKSVPTYAVSTILKVEEKESQKLAKLALAAEKALIKFIEASKASYNVVLDAKIKDAEMRENKRPNGSLSMSSFDHSLEVKITKPETTYFDSTYISMVKQKFDNYFNGLHAGNETAQLLQDVVNELLFTKSGHLDMSKVLQLRKFRERIQGSPKMREKGQPFVEAVDLLDKAIKTKPGNPGIYVTIEGRRVALKYTDI